jgi:hypothetical protein
MKSSWITVGGRGVRVQGRFIRTGRLAGDKCVFIDDPAPLLQALKTSPERVDIFTFMQRLPASAPKYAYPMEWDNLAVLEVSTFDHWWNEQIRSYPRNRARQAEKRGVTLREVPFGETLAQGMCDVYNESAVRQGRPNTHYGKDVATVYREAATFLDQSIFIGAYFEGQLIGFVKLVMDDTRTQANLMNIVAMVKHRDKAPTNALIAHSVRACADRGIRYLVYQNFTYGNKKSDSLTNFKEVNGFKQVDIPRYFVPVTALGRAAVRLQLHRRLVDRLPAPLAAKLRDLVSAWYNRRLRSAGETA